MAIINVEEIARETELSVAASLESIARQIRARHASTSEGPSEVPWAVEIDTPSEDKHAGVDVDTHTPVGEVVTPPAVDDEQPKPKRKRRTKAQIEADNAAAAAAAKYEARAEATAPVEDEGPDENVDTEAATSTDEESDWAPEWPT